MTDFQQPGLVNLETGETFEEIKERDQSEEDISIYERRITAEREGRRRADEKAGLARRIKTTRADTIIPDSTTWLWAPGRDKHGRIPVGEVTLIVGRGNSGKSTLMCTMAAWITVGDMQGAFYGTPRDILYITNEDSRERTVVPRLIAAGADLSRVHFIDISDGDQEGRIMLPTDCAEIERVAAETGAVAALIDPLTSNLKVDNSNDQKKVRTVLEATRRMCERANIAVIGLAHTRKQDSRNLMDAIMGSSELGNVCRSAMGAMKDPEEEDAIVLSQEKSNLGRTDIPSYKYHIQNHTFTNIHGKIIDIGKLKFLGKTDQKVSEMMAEVMTNAGGISSVKECSDWLYSWLSFHGEKPRIEVMAAARKEGYQEHTVKRAAAKIKVVFRREGWPSVTMWSLPQSRND